MSSVVALLGPTNTGKTHRAIERMLEHPTGMLGLPLRLLAREVYDRVTARIGELEVALVTGEEKRVPPRPRFWVCTTEAMPLDRPVDFLAVDEIQLSAHPQRGHVFTDRLLHARGERETWFLGSETMRPIVEELVPVAQIRRHPRFSRLSVGGSVNLASLPPRSALIAFSAEEVYRLADRLRGRRGGAAVVLGALSPRTRNAQVAMYQSGEVEHLVATDAIGMGLNLDLDHVAFASLTKFDGREVRSLEPEEVGQIAGRAGRHVRDGTFGTLSPVELPADVAFAVESHRFASVRRVWWRNSNLDASSVVALLASLAERPRHRLLHMVEQADDHAALRALAERREILDRAATPSDVRLLWQVCEIPDFRKLLPEHHANLLAEIFLELVGGGGCLSEDFLLRHLRRLESAEGDIDALMIRLQLVRTWGYVAHRSEWLRHPAEWQARTARAEDAISEALHQRLVERFVDRPGRARRARASQSRAARAPSSFDDRRVVSGGPFAALAGLRAKGSHGSATDEPDEVGAWVDGVVAATFDAFVVDDAGVIRCEGERIAQLVRGADLLHPEVKLALDRNVPQGRQSMLLRRARAFVRDWVRRLVEPLDPAPLDSPLHGVSSSARGLLHQLTQALGTVPVHVVRDALCALTPEDRGRFDAAGIRTGRRSVYARGLVDSSAVRQRAALVNAFRECRPVIHLDGGAVAVERNGRHPEGALGLCGYEELGPIAIRADAVEALLVELEVRASAGPFRGIADLASQLGRTVDELESALVALGFTETEAGFVGSSRRSRGSSRGRLSVGRRGG